MELGHVGELSNSEHRKTTEKSNNLTARIATLAAKNNMFAGEFACSRSVASSAARATRSASR
jgi:hypothetical protein